jgi:streptogramin lyase
MVVGMLFLLACTGEEPKVEDSGGDEVACGNGPHVEIISPSEGDHVPLGSTVALEAEGSGAGLVKYTWGIDSDAFATGRTANWIPDEAGAHILTVQAEDDCGSTQDSLNITVDPVEGDDTGDTGDTAPPAQPEQVVYDESAGIPAANWHGLDVASDGTLWATGSAGLVHLDPETGAVRVYTSADGLTTDEPYGVLAHSDGTLWLGHLADNVRQGEQVSVDGDGTLTHLRDVDFVETDEIAAVFRIREQPYGQGVGEVWMGTNEGLCVFDPSLGAFYEHAHPDHPHGYTRGVAMTEDGTVWNGDEYHLTRWQYAQDGVLSPSSGSANLVEIQYLWPVLPEEEPIGLYDLDATGSTVWVASYVFGVARVEAAEAGTPSSSQVYASPWPAIAYAVRVGPDGAVWVGAADGLYRYDGSDLTHWAGAEWLPSDVVQQLAVDEARDTVWVATPGGIVKLVGVPA